MKRVNWKAWLGTLGGLGIGLGSVLGSTTPPPPPKPQLPPLMTTKPADPAATAKPATALQTGIDLYQKGDYEAAQPWLGQAGLNRASLNPADQKKLDEFVKKNDDAVKQRTAAIQQLAKASELVSTGKYSDADSMVKSLKSSKWLKADEQQHVTYLGDMIKKNNPPKSSGLFPKGDKPKGPDPDELLTQARKAYEQNHLDLAESLAKQSETAGFRTFNLFADTPAKVLKDVETAKKKAEASKPVPGADAKNAAAKALLKQAHEAVVANDLVKAKKLLKDAEEMKPTIGYWEEYTPEKVKGEIAKTEKAAAVKPPVADKQPPKPPVADNKLPKPPATDTKPPVKKDETPNTAAETKAMVKAARQALNEEKLDQAEEMAKQARKANVKFGTFEDSPDKVLADVLKARDVSDYGQAAKLLDEARKKFEANQLDAAENLTFKAEQLRKNYPVWYRGERPDKLRAEIATKKRLAGKPKFPELDPNADPKKIEPKDPIVKEPGKDPIKPVEKADPRRPDALQQLALARQHIQKGDLPSAWELAAKVKRMNVAFKPGDETPDEIFRAVEAIQASQMAKKEPQMAELNRQKALKCLGDARFLMKEGKLVDAMQCVQEAKTHKALFKTGDDTPDACVAELQSLCQKQIDMYTEAGVTLQKSERHAEAMKYFQYVFNLEKAFQIDTHAIAQLMDQTQKQMGGKPPAPADTIGEGQKLLAEADKELLRGEIIKSRQLAEAVYIGNFNMKYQAMEMLKKIDRKEEQLAKKKTMNFYEVGVAAFKRKDFASAAQYLQSLDMRLLDEAKRSHAQEMLASSDMQPFALKNVANKGTDDPPGKVIVGDPEPANPKQPTMLSEYQKKQQIARDATRVQVLQASQEANRLAAKGDLDSAVRMLESSRASLRESGIDADLLAPLFRQLDDRLRVFSQMREQVALNAIKKQADSKHLDVLKEKDRHEQHKKDVVGKYMAAYQTFIKEGKFKEAEAQAMLAREVDPDDPAIEAAAFKAQMMRRASDDRKFTNDNERMVYQSTIDNNPGKNFPSDENPMMFDRKTWNQAGGRRVKLNAPLRPESPKDKESSGKLAKTTVDVNFENRPLRKVLDDLNELAGVNFFLDVQSITADNISVDQPVTCRFNKEPISTVLNLVLKSCKLTYHIQNGVVIITTPLGASGQPTRRVYPVADLIIPIDNYATVGAPVTGSLAALPKAGAEPPMSNGNKSPWSIQDGTPVSSPGGGHATQPRGKAARAPGQHMDDLLIDLITKTIEPNSWVSQGGQGVIEYYPLGHQLVVSQTENIQELVDLLLNRLRELQEVQVTVEVRFVQLSESFYERIGLDMDLRIGTDQTNFFDKIVGSNPNVPAGFINKNQHLENIIVGLTPTGTFTTDLDIPVNVSSFNRAIPPFGGFPNTPGNNGGIDFGLAFLSDIEVFLFLEAAQGDRRTNVSQAPKISLYNGQTANLTLQDTQLFTTNVTAAVINGQVVFTPVITPLQNGLSMDVNAVVSADRRYVRLAIRPIIQSVAPEVPLFPITVFITPVIADDISGTPIPFQQFIQQPSQTTQTIITTVNVPDGGTVLMGGLKTLSEGRNEFGPPILSKIPYLSRFFRNVGYGREARSLMFMVTPRIIIQEEEEERLGNTFAF